MGRVELGTCSNTIRWIFILFNVLILLAGLVTFGLGVWQQIVVSVFEVVLSEDYTSGWVLFIVLGILLVVVSIIGVVGASYKWRQVLLVYLALVLLVIVLEIASFAYMFAKADDIDEDQIEQDLIRALRRYYPSNNTAYDERLNNAVDFIQGGVGCCGITNYTDWANYSPYTMELGWLPASCCRRGEPAACPVNEASDDGCREAVTEYVQDNLIIGGIIGTVSVVVEFSLLVMSVVLFKAIKNASVLTHAGGDDK